MIVYAAHITTRLQYIANFVSNYWYGTDATLTNIPEVFLQSSLPRINYSHDIIAVANLQIIPHGLLSETAIQQQDISCEQKPLYPVIFSNDSEMGFDIFTAIFFLISRYEEYLPGTTDLYGRYDFKNSVAWKHGFLQKPVINCWLQDIAPKMSAIFPGTKIIQPQFTPLPTYDIDMARCYQHKGFFRNMGGLLRDLLKLQFSNISARIQVLSGNKKDPYDTFGWLHQLHEKNKLKPYYFFLVAQKTGDKDKNIAPHKKVMQALIADHAIRYPIGLHPSWQSGDDTNILIQEKALLGNIIGKNINASRQHFLRMTMPETYRSLIEQGLLFDFTMGYSGAHGFRAGVATPFYWYDLKNEAVTPLLVFPFCYMEASSIYYTQETPEQALQELTTLYNNVKQVNGFFSMIWHNHTLADTPEFSGWRKMYQLFIESIHK